MSEIIWYLSFSDWLISLSIMIYAPPYSLQHIYNIQDLKIAQVSIRIGVDKTIVHLQNGILLSYKNEGGRRGGGKNGSKFLMLLLDENAGRTTRSYGLPASSMVCMTLLMYIWTSIHGTKVQRD